MDEGLATTLDSFASRFTLGIVIAVLFGIGWILLMKLFDLLASRQADRLSERD